MKILIPFLRITGAYKPAKSAEPISSVATDMAKTVTSLYPTLTVSFSEIVAVSITNFDLQRMKG